MRLRWRLGTALYFCERLGGAARRRSTRSLQRSQRAAEGALPGAAAGQVVTGDEMGGEKERDWRARQDAQTGSPAVASLPA